MLTQNTLIHPGLFLIFISFIYNFIPRILRKSVAILSPIIAYILMTARMKTGDFDIIFHYHIHAFSFIIFFLIALLAGILFAFSNFEDKNNDIKFALLYAGASISTILSDNLLVIFIFLEIMLVSSSFLIFNGKNKLSSYMAIAYFKIHIIAATAFLIALTLHYLEHKNLSITRYDLYDFTSPKITIMHYVMLIALLIKIALPPFSYWLTEGYSSASPAGSVFLSIYTTKTAIFLLLKIFIGNKSLIYLGIFMSFYGIIYATLENNLRKIVSYNIVTQLGLILIAIAIGDEVSKDAAILMSITGIVYISLAMMCAGVIVILLNKKRYYSTSFLAKKFPFLFICSIIAFTSIAAIPFSAGYIGKYFLYQSDYVINNPLLKNTITSISAGMMFSVGIKFLVFTFLEDFKPKDINKKMITNYNLSTCGYLGLSLLSFCLISIGFFPNYILHTEVFFLNSLSIDYLLLLLGSFVGFLLLQRFITYKEKATLIDFDWIYRYFLYRFYKIFYNLVVYIHDKWVRNKDNIHQYSTNFMIIIIGPNGFFAYFKSLNFFITVTIILLILLLINIT